MQIILIVLLTLEQVSVKAWSSVSTPKEQMPYLIFQKKKKKAQSIFAK